MSIGYQGQDIPRSNQSYNNFYFFILFFLHLNKINVGLKSDIKLWKC